MHPRNLHYLPNEDLIRACVRTPTEKTPARHDDPHKGVVSAHENLFIMQTQDLIGVEGKTPSAPGCNVGSNPDCQSM